MVYISHFLLVSIIKVETKENIAYMVTKTVTSSMFKHCLDLLGVSSTYSQGNGGANMCENPSQESPM